MSRHIDIHASLDKMKNAGQVKDWRAMARELLTVQKYGSWRQSYTSIAAWMSAASEATGYSSGMLQRMAATMRFLIDVQSAEGGDRYAPLLDAEDVPKLSLAAVELIKRMTDIDPKAGHKLLDKVAGGKASYIQVKRAYDDFLEQREASQAAGKVGQASPGTNIRLARKQTEDAFNVVKQHLSELVKSDEVSAHFRQYRFQFVSTEGVAISRKGFHVEYADGMEFRFYRVSRTRMPRKSLLAEIAFAATFFRSYWLFVADYNKDVEWIDKKLRSLGIDSIGIAVVTMDGEGEVDVVVKTKPRQSTVMTDRQKIILEEIYEQGLARRA